MGGTVRRYPFPVPEWCRTIWVSAAAEALWRPRIARISAAWNAAERASVGTIRDAARQSVRPDDVAELSRKAAESGLTLVVLGQSGAAQHYSAGPVPVRDGQPWNYTAALVRSPKAGRLFTEAWKAGDDEAIGQLLGFPSCCRRFFQRVWVKEQWADTTWPMALETAYHATDDRFDDPETPLLYDVFSGTPREANIMLRWAGLRWVPHLPCSFSCQPTHVFGEQFRAVMHGGGHAQEAEWLDELLDMAVEWSAWHGIAEVKTPLFKVSTKTDATAERLVVRRAGRRLPEAAARGNTFPYTASACATVPQVQPLRFVRPAPATAPQQAVQPAGEHEWRDNGFSSAAGMAQAHDKVADFVHRHVPQRATVLDLGCGGAQLVRRLATDYAYGVERDAAVAARAAALLGQRGEVATGDIYSLPWGDSHYDVVLVMPGRLVEQPDRLQRERVVRDLRRCAGRVVVYAYGDWVAKHGGLAGLCAAAGLPRPDHVEETSAVAVGLLPAAFDRKSAAERIGGPAEVYGVLVTGATREQFTAKHDAMMREAGRESWRAPGRITARVNHGRWVADCPYCRRAMAPSRVWQVGCCFACGARFEGDAVVFPPNADAIEQALLLRLEQQRNWEPGKTLNEILKENEGATRC